MNEERLRRELVEASRAIHAAGWVANHDGNLSARLADDRLLITPTSVSKGAVSAEMLLVVGPDGAVLQGSRRPFSELRLHRVAYKARADVAVVLHAHPPTATGFAVAGVPLGPPFMAEPVVSLGRDIPLVPYGLVGDAALDSAVAEALAGADALLLAGHGVLTVGPDVETALLRLELVEHLAKIALVARQLGGPRPLPAADVDRLLQSRQKAGLGPAPRASAGASEPGFATAPTPEVSRIVEEALRRFRN